MPTLKEGRYLRSFYFVSSEFENVFFSDRKNDRIINYRWKVGVKASERFHFNLIVDFIIPIWELTPKIFSLKKYERLIFEAKREYPPTFVNIENYNFNESLKTSRNIVLNDCCKVCGLVELFQAMILGENTWKM